MKFAIILAGFYLMYAATCFFWQRRLLFPRRLIPAPPAPTLPAGAQRIWLSCGFGRVESWYLPTSTASPESPAPVLLFAHGNGELIDDWPEVFAALPPKGIGVFLVEYPGYGRSAGTPTQASVTATMIAAYNWIIRQPEIDSERVILMGRSLGGGAVCRLAARRPSAAMVLVSAFTGVKPFARNFLMPAFLVRDAFDNLSVVRTFRKPLLLVHGRYDTVVPYQHALQLHAAAPGSRLLTYECGHNDCPPAWPPFWDRLLDFLRVNGIVQDRPDATQGSR